MAAHNLIIAYDLIRPGQDYETVRNRIKQLGSWQQFQYSLFYVHTASTPQQAYNHIIAGMDPNDKLIVVNALGFVSSTPQSVINAINRLWRSEAA